MGDHSETLISPITGGVSEFLALILHQPLLDHLVHLVLHRYEIFVSDMEQTLNVLLTYVKLTRWCIAVA